MSNQNYYWCRCGDIVRCDIPPPHGRSDAVYAFVEFYESRDAERAYYDLHGRPFMGGTLKIQVSYFVFSYCINLHVCVSVVG
jgi:hypothetical protein